MDETNDDKVDMNAVAARLHHEVRHFEPVRLLRDVLKVGEEEMLQRLAALFGYDDVEELPAPKTGGEIEIDEQIVAWFMLELMVFTFAHQSVRLGHTPAYYVPDVNPFLMELDRCDESMPGFLLSLPLKRAEVFKKEYQLPFLRMSLSKMEDSLAVGVWVIRCDEPEVYWTFRGVSGGTSGALAKKVREHGGRRIPRADEEKMVELAEMLCK